MKRATHAAHPELGRLLAWWFGEVAGAEQDELEAHLLSCSACTAVLEAVTALGTAVRALSAEGAVQAVVSDAFVARLAQAGLRVREYRVAHNGSVNCHVGADDQVMVARLEAPLADVRRLDLLADDLQGRGAERWTDIPFDAARGEVVFTPRIGDLRALPAYRSQVRLLAVDAPGRERLLGVYTFNHAPGDAG